MRTNYEIIEVTPSKQRRVTKKGKKTKTYTFTAKDVGRWHYGNFDCFGNIHWKK